MNAVWDRLWRFYRVMIFPMIHALSGGGSLQGCRHSPSCSEFALEQVKKSGIFSGGWAGLLRILSCHPW